MDKQKTAECLIRISCGDLSALKELYEMLNVPLYTYIYRITLDRALAEDCLQDTFLKLAKPVKTDIKNPTAYIYTAARNTAIDAVRKKRAFCDDCNEVCESFENSSVLRLDTESALRSLEGDVRQIITLRISSELTFSDISRITDMSLSAVYRKYLKGIAELKKILSGGLV